MAPSLHCYVWLPRSGTCLDRWVSSAMRRATYLPGRSLAHSLLRRTGGNGRLYEFLLSNGGTGQHQHYFKRQVSNLSCVKSRSNHVVFAPSIDIDFIGTCAMIPSKTRNTSCLRVQIQGRSWIFDAGENTQVNFQKFGVSPPKIDKIFITHTHGDHILGLPGILMAIRQCQRNSDINLGKNLKPIEIYGPRGLRAYLRAITTYTQNRFPPYRVHELHDSTRDSPFKAHEDMINDSTINDVSTEKSNGDNDRKRHDERNIVADEDGLYKLCKDEFIEVIAGKVHHTAPTYGFVLLESELKPNVNGPLGKRILSKHAKEITQHMNKNDFFGMLRKLHEDEYLEFQNGAAKYNATELRSPAPPSRKITILGDCCGIDDALKDLSKNSDVLVHELTNPGLPELNDAVQSCSDNIMKERGHSNCSIFAGHLRELRPKTVYLNHMSQKYSKYFPVDSETGKASVEPEFVDIIRKGIFQHVPDDEITADEKITAEEEVHIAYDGLQVTVPVDYSVVESWQEDKGIPRREKHVVKNKHDEKGGRGFWQSIKSIFGF